MLRVCFWAAVAVHQTAEIGQKQPSCSICERADLTYLDTRGNYAAPGSAPTEISRPWMSSLTLLKH